MQRTPAMSGGVSFTPTARACELPWAQKKKYRSPVRCIESPKRSIWKLPNIVREHYYSFSLPPAEHYYSSTALARLRALSPLCPRKSGTTLASAGGGAPYAPQGLAPPFTDAVIWMRCAKKPRPQKGANKDVRDRIAERGFDKAGR